MTGSAQTSLVIALVIISGTTRAQDLPDEQVRPKFVQRCGELAEAIPDFALPCEDFAKGRTPQVLRQYLALAETVSAGVLSKGPQIAKELLTSCLANAGTKTPDPGELLFCLMLTKRNNDLEKLAKGDGTLKDYGRLTKDATDPIPVYPADNTADAENQRAEVRKALVYSCIEQGEGYTKALCGAVAVHEIFAARPFGDNGELAKAFDTVVTLYAVAEAPRQIIQGEIKEALQRAGINDQVATAISNPEKGTVESVKHVANEAKKIIENIVPDIKLW